MTFRNTSSERFRLPDQINPPPYNFWYLKLRNTGTGKNYTGISTRPMGAAPEPGEITPAVLRNGETKTVSVTFAAFAFVEGDMDFQAARNIWFPSRLDNQSSFALPAGAYDIRVMVRFRSSPDRAAIANDPVPLWKGAEVLSSSTSIKVSSDAEPTRAELIQIARDRAISALDFLAFAQLDSDFVSTRNHSGLWNDLRVVEAAANDLKIDDNADSVTPSARVQKLNAAIIQSSMRAVDISTRSTETANDRTKARQLASKLREFTVPFHTIP
jgi:hypothetical protein